MNDATELDALLAKADAIVANAFEASYRPDPILGSISRVHSICKSITRAHGLLLEEAIAFALRRGGRIEVSRGIRFPITDAARALVATNQGPTLDRVRLAFESEARTSFDLDLAAVTTDGSRAWAVDIKRGAGMTSGSRRAQVERELLAVKLLLRSFFRQQGYPADDVSVAVIDVYGAGGFTSGLTVTRNDIDAFFGAPVLDIVDALDDRLRKGLEATWTRHAGAFAQHARPSSCDALGPGGSPDPDDTPVATTRVQWGTAFAIRPAGQATARPHSAHDRAAGHRGANPHDRGWRGMPGPRS